MRRHPSTRAALTGASAVTFSLALGAAATPASAAGNTACSGNAAGLTLPPGFCATVFADHIGHARHLVVAQDGSVYVNTWSGRYYHNDKPHDGGFGVALKDTRGDGLADRQERFGMTPGDGGHGGTGIQLHDGKVYLEEADTIEAYPLSAGAMAPKAGKQVIVSGMPMGGDHPMHPFLIDAKGDMFVDMGTATNACQKANRQPRSPGYEPCRELETRGGTWRFSADKAGQRYGSSDRYATGIRNGEGFAFDTAGRLFVTQHGRDQLWENWPELYKQRQGAELPAEEVMALKQGGDYGWPECYYDQFQGKLVLAPEYGGDGGHKVGVCADKIGPTAHFPGHWAPNDLAIDTNSKQFPSAYKDALFIAFHGSWNRAPSPQGGYNIVVQPMKDGRPSGRWVVFADGFAGAQKDPGAAKHRPSGLAFGPDGALYVADDVGGTVYRITYNGSVDAPVTAAPNAEGEQSATADAVPPEGIHADAGREVNLPAPPGATRQEVSLGSKIFHGELKNGTCTGCHGANGEGGQQGPKLTDHAWLWSDGNLAGIETTIADGVPKPKQYNEPMPAKGGVDLSPDDVKAVASYVWAISHPNGKHAAN